MKEPANDVVTQELLSLWSVIMLVTGFRMFPKPSSSCPSCSGRVAQTLWWSLSPVGLVCDSSFPGKPVWSHSSSRVSHRHKCWPESWWGCWLKMVLSWTICDHSHHVLRLGWVCIHHHRHLPQNLRGCLPQRTFSWIVSRWLVGTYIPFCLFWVPSKASVIPVKLPGPAVCSNPARSLCSWLFADFSEWDAVVVAA